MKHREVVIFSGQQFLVPQGIQRIDTRSTHGWQVRYQGTKFFSDGSQDGSGASASLDRAIRHLVQRIAQHPAPVTIQSAPSVHKSSGLPSGISGPIVRGRAGSSMRVAEFSIVLPRFGQTPRRRTVYIGNENTYTPEKYNAALAKAMALRAEAEESYRADATRARRQAAKTLTRGTAQAVIKPPRKRAAKPAAAEAVAAPTGKTAARRRVATGSQAASSSATAASSRAAKPASFSGSFIPAEARSATRARRAAAPAATQPATRASAAPAGKAPRSGAGQAATAAPRKTGGPAARKAAKAR